MSDAMNSKFQGLVLFGSQSDEKIYSLLLKELKERNVDSQFYVVSAHRDPELLANILKTEKYDFVIAGAGLSAHLPGVVASQILKPVFGIPISSQLEGLDSYYSISQMPFGVPVLSTGANYALTLANFIRYTQDLRYFYVKQTRDMPLPIRIVVDSDYKSHKEFKRFKDLQSRYGLNIQTSDVILDDSHSLNIVVAKLSNMHQCKLIQDKMILVPYIEDSKSIDASISLVKITQEYLTVGINNLRNAILFGLQLFNIKNQYDEVLANVRKK